MDPSPVLLRGGGRRQGVGTARRPQSEPILSLSRASQGYFNMERGITDKSVMLLVLDTLRSVLKEVGA